MIAEKQSPILTTFYDERFWSQFSNVLRGIEQIAFMRIVQHFQQFTAIFWLG